MGFYQSAVVLVAIATWLCTPTHAAFVAQPDGSLLEDFNDGVVDTATWTVATAGGHLVTVSEANGELKYVETATFNGAYNTLRNGVDDHGVSDGTGWVEPKTAGNNNHRVRAIMRRKDDDDRVWFGLSMTVNSFDRSHSDAGRFMTIVWEWGTGLEVTDYTVGQVVPFSGTPEHRASQFRPEICFDNPSQPGQCFLKFGVDNFVPAPVWDYTGKTRYAFEIDWPTITSVEFLVQEVLRPDQNNDLETDIVDFGIFAGDFGKSGAAGDLNWDGTFSDFDDSGAVDIIDFGQFAGAFGQDPNELYQLTHDFSGGQCCFPSSLGIGIQAHNAGTAWADYVHIFGDGTTASEHSPDLPLPSR